MTNTIRMVSKTFDMIFRLMKKLHMYYVNVFKLEFELDFLLDSCFAK